MRKKRFTEHQIIKVLKQVEGGRSVQDVCRGCGVSQATYYNWKSKYGGMEASDIRKMKDLEKENQTYTIRSSTTHKLALCLIDFGQLEYNPNLLTPRLGARLSFALAEHNNPI